MKTTEPIPLKDWIADFQNLINQAKIQLQKCHYAWINSFHVRYEHLGHFYVYITPLTIPNSRMTPNSSMEIKGHPPSASSTHHNSNIIIPPPNQSHSSIFILTSRTD